MAVDLRTRRALGEFVLIVLGVVAALGVDRWVQGIDERASEANYLELIEADLIANRGVLESWVFDWSASEEATAYLLALASGTEPRPDPGTLTLAWARAGATNTIPLREASFQDLQSSGNLGLIRDLQLRNRIVRYYTQDIMLGRPQVETRLDYRIRQIARELVPATFVRFREACAEGIPIRECTGSVIGDEEMMWQELQRPGMGRLLNSRLADAISITAIARQWAEANESLIELIQSR